MMKAVMSFVIGLGVSFYALIGAVYTLSGSDLTAVQTLGSDFGSSLLTNFLSILTAFISLIVIYIIIRMVRSYIR